MDLADDNLHHLQGAMNMAKSKSKIDFKQLLLAKGEYFALGLAGLFLGILLLSSVSKWISARDPVKISKDLKESAKRVNDKINNGELTPDDESKTVPPAWVVKEIKYPIALVQDFALTNPQFDPIAKPDTKKENPTVLDFDPNGYQVELLRYPFKAYDIISDQEGNIKIAVIVDKPVGKVDNDELRKVAKNLAKQGSGIKRPPVNNPGPPPAPSGPGNMGGSGRPGLPGGRSSMGGQSFDNNAQRMATAIKYIPIDELDKAMEEGKLPALTVIPLRGALIYMEVPYKKQLEEIKRALRLPTTAEAQQWGPTYEGYEVQRRVTQPSPDGTPEVVSDWAPYNFEEKYLELINSRKVADTFEDGYLSYFIRYDMQLALPLPQLVSELGKYPDITLPNILNSINKLKEAGKEKIPPSETAERLKGQNLSKDNIYHPQVGDGNALYGDKNVTGVGGAKQPKLNSPTGPGTVGPDPKANTAAPTEIDSLLLRFIDVDIEPGYTYEYRIRVKMKNPNFGRTTEVSNPADAKVETLYSKWFSIDSRNSRITIPPEQYVYAADVGTYRRTIEETYAAARERELRDRLQVKDYQAVVEICRWLPSVTLDSGTQREPVGAWVVADVPVGRGEYVGKKTYVKLPLWSSESKAYVLREISQLVGKVGSGQWHLPKGWLVNFVTPDILVDFSGGRVQTRLGTKNIIEDVGTELLIVSPDGKLTVKKSAVDDADANRRQITGVWTRWVTEVEKRKEEAKKDDTGSFAPKPGIP